MYLLLSSSFISPEHILHATFGTASLESLSPYSAEKHGPNVLHVSYHGVPCTRPAMTCTVTVLIGTCEGVHSRLVTSYDCRLKVGTQISQLQSMLLPSSTEHVKANSSSTSYTYW